jgi:hypothetical protein
MMRSSGVAVIVFAIAAVLAAAQIVSACEGNKILLQDDFKTLASNWGTVSDNQAVKDGKMVLTPSLNATYVTLDSGYLFTDMDACVDVAITKAGPQMVHTYGGIAFWASDYHDYYELMIGPSGTFGVDRILPGRRVSIMPFTDSPAVKRGMGQVNRLRVQTKGNNATLYINGTRVGSIGGQPPQGGGQIGVTAQAGPKTRDVYEFTNLKVTN